MALWVCEGCGTRYAVGLSSCPRCRSKAFHEEGASVPKITVHGGATNADVTVQQAVEQVAAQPPLTEGDMDRSGPTPQPEGEGKASGAAKADPDPTPASEEEGDPPSAGSSSDPSSPSTPPSGTQPEADDPSPAPTAANRFSTAQPEPDSADSTGGTKAEAARVSRTRRR